MKPGDVMIQNRDEADRSIAALVSEFPGIVADYERIIEFLEGENPYAGAGYDAPEEFPGVFGFPIYSPMAASEPAAILVYSIEEYFGTTFIYISDAYRAKDFPTQRRDAFTKAASR